MKIECDELLVICDNCGHAIHVKELDNNLIKLNNKNDKLISEQDAIDALIEWYGCEPNGMDYFKEILAKKSPAQPVDKDINVPTNDTISRQAAIDAVHHAFDRETLLNRFVRKVAVDALKTMPSAQPEIIHCGECKHRDPEDHKCDCGHDIIWQLPRDDKWYCADAERRTDD